MKAGRFTIAIAILIALTGCYQYEIIKPVEPVKATKITLRCANWQASGKPFPLIIVDGKESDQQMLNLINPNQIQEITILKSPDQTAQYGKKARQGVILITLKK